MIKYQMIEYVTKNMFAYRALRQSIIVGDYAPHQRLVLKDLAADLNTSIMPVREALRLLEKDGLVTQVAHQGFTVSGLSIREIDELFDLRLSLEHLSIDLVAKQNPDDLPEKLMRLIDEMVVMVEENSALAPVEPLPREHRDRFMAINWDFHLEIAQATGYRHLPNFLNSVFDMSERYMNLLEFVVGLDMGDVDEHRRVVMHLEAGDRDGALAAMTDHIGAARAKLTSYATRSGWADEEDR